MACCRSPCMRFAVSFLALSQRPAYLRVYFRRRENDRLVSSFTLRSQLLKLLFRHRRIKLSVHCLCKSSGLPGSEWLRHPQRQRRLGNADSAWQYLAARASKISSPSLLTFSPSKMATCRALSFVVDDGCHEIGLLGHKSIRYLGM
jgi:hypothetical protein